jgi:hypothetical protein
MGIGDILAAAGRGSRHALGKNLGHQIFTIDFAEVGCFNFSTFSIFTFEGTMALCESCGTSVSGSPTSCANCGSALETGRPVGTQTVSEQVLLDESGVFVSNFRLVSNGQTFAMSGITSVRTIVKKPSKVGPLVAMALGATMVILPRVEPILSSGDAELIFGVGLFFLGLLILFIPKGRAVLIHSSSGETQTFPSKDKALIQKIVDALNQAIIIRG